jgi:hypothetical protein
MDVELQGILQAAIQQHHCSSILCLGVDFMSESVLSSIAVYNNIKSGIAIFIITTERWLVERSTIVYVVEVVQPY